MKNALYLLALTFTLFSCKKDKIPSSLNETLPGGNQTVLKTGTFSSNVHTTSGTIKIVEDANRVKSIVFENFKTDAGPDLKVWLSPNTTGSTYQELGTLKATSGNFSYTLGSDIDYTTNNKVLIWCKQFSVLFGNATLQ